MRDGIQLDPAVQMTFHSEFDPQALTVSFLDDTVELQPMYDALRELHDHAVGVSDSRAKFERRAVEARMRFAAEGANKLATDVSTDGPSEPDI